MRPILRGGEAVRKIRKAVVSNVEYLIIEQRPVSLRASGQQKAAPTKPCKLTDSGSGLDAIDEDDALFVVDFFQSNFDNFGFAGLHVAADELGFNGHFAVAAIDQDAQ